MDFGRLITAMVTPFDEELDMNLEITEKLVHHLVETGTDSIVVAGTTGEGPTLTKDEKLTLFKKVKEVGGKRIKVIANAGSNNTRETIKFVTEIEDYGVADAIMLVAPYYNKPTQEGLYEHFRTIAENTDLPIMLYNIPSRTGVNIEANTTIKLSKIKNIVAVKESSGNLNQMTKIISESSEGFAVYSGDDNLTLPILSIGGKGVVSVASHVIGRQLKEMMDAYERRNTQQAAKIHQRLLPLFEDLFFKTNPIPIKNILRLKGIDVGSVRLPLVDLTQDDIVFLKLMMGNINF